MFSQTPRGEPTPSRSLAENAPAKDPLQARRDQALLRALDSKTLVPEFQKGALPRVLWIALRRQHINWIG